MPPIVNIGKVQFISELDTIFKRGDGAIWQLYKKIDCNNHYCSGTLYALKTLGFDSRLILCGAPIAVGVLVYAIAAVKIKVITREDCLLLPKGEKIAKLLKL